MRVGDLEWASVIVQVTRVQVWRFPRNNVQSLLWLTMIDSPDSPIVSLSFLLPNWQHTTAYLANNWPAITNIFDIQLDVYYITQTQLNKLLPTALCLPRSRRSETKIPWISLTLLVDEWNNYLAKSVWKKNVKFGIRLLVYYSSTLRLCGNCLFDPPCNYVPKKKTSQSTQEKEMVNGTCEAVERRTVQQWLRPEEKSYLYLLSIW